MGVSNTRNKFICFVTDDLYPRTIAPIVCDGPRRGVLQTPLLSSGKCNLSSGKCNLSSGKCNLSSGKCNLSSGECNLSSGECNSLSSGECNSPLPISNNCMMPCIWFGITTNSCNFTLGRISGVFIHSLYAICPYLFKIIVPFLTCPKRQILSSQQIVIKYKPACE